MPHRPLRPDPHQYGTFLFAVGGNAEAARRAGINVNRVYVGAFVTRSTLAALGGVLAASRLAAANQSTGTGDVNLNAIAAPSSAAPRSSAAAGQRSLPCSECWSSSRSPRA